MEDFLYAYNQPVVNAKYDLILDGKIIANEVVTKSGSIGGGEDTSNYVKINDPITITEGDNTTSITSDTISTTTLSGTLDAESMKNSLTAEAIQAVMPVAWGSYTTAPTATDANAISIGGQAESLGYGVSIGNNAKAGLTSVSVGYNAKAQTSNAIAIGGNTKAKGAASVVIGLNSTDGGWTRSVAIGTKATGTNPTTITIGSEFTEATDSGDVTHTCTTESTGSITIGAGANTLNNGDTESSNSVTIGCKAENKGADSVVIGAGAKVEGNAAIAIGARAEAKKTEHWGSGTAVGTSAKANMGGVAIGQNATTNHGYAVSVGYGANASYSGTAVGHGASSKGESIALGYNAYTEVSKTIAFGVLSKAFSSGSIAIGHYAQAADYGATVIRSTAEDGTYTQLYFSGANTPLALKYYPTEWEKKQDVDEQGNPKVDDEGNPIMIDDKDKPTKGQAMMGYVVSKEVTNAEGKKEIQVVECGTNLLAALFPNHGLGDNPFQPTTTAIDDEEIMSFHPSDLDLPIEETPIEEEYKPLPIYPIVEPTIDEITE